MAPFRFLSNHGLVLASIAQDPSTRDGARREPLDREQVPG